MESYSDKNNNVIGVKDFNLIRSLIEGHYANLQNQLDFLDRIEITLISKKNSQQTKKDSLLTDNEIRLYLMEQSLPLITSKNLNEYIFTILPQIRFTLESVIKDYENLRTVVNIQDKDKALLFLGYILEYENTKANLKSSFQKIKNLVLENQIEAAFHDLPFYKDLAKVLEPLLPSTYVNNFRKVFLVKTFGKKVRADTEFIVRRVTNWESILSEIQTHKTKNKILSPKDLDELNGYEDRIKQREVFNVKFCKNEQDKKDEKKFYKEIENNIELFFSIHGVFGLLDRLSANQVSNNAAEINKKEKDHEKAFNVKSAQIKKLLNQWEKKFKENQTLFAQVKTQLNNKELEMEVEKAEQILGEINQAILSLFEDWPQKLPEEVKTNEDVDQFFEGIQKSYQDYLHKMGDLKSQILDVRTKQQEIIKSNIAQTEEARKSQLKKVQERRATLSQNLQLFRDKKSHEREERLIRQKEARKSLIEKNTPKEEPLQKYQNTEMHQLLMNLKEDKIQLIKDILDPESKREIFYDDVENLFLNHLNGKLVEIGNGSSHKRLLMDKYIIEVRASASQAEIENHSKSTGGFFKPHQKGHNDQKLSPCNIILVRKTFEKAGLTLEKIKEIEIAKRLNVQTQL